MRKIFYLSFSALAYVLAVAYELCCRYSDRNAQHAAPPPRIRRTGRHTASYVRNSRAITYRFGSQPVREVAA